MIARLERTSDSCETPHIVIVSIRGEIWSNDILESQATSLTDTLHAIGDGSDSYHTSACVLTEECTCLRIRDTIEGVVSCLR